MLPASSIQGTLHSSRTAVVSVYMQAYCFNHPVTKRVKGRATVTGHPRGQHYILNGQVSRTVTVKYDAGCSKHLPEHKLPLRLAAPLQDRAVLGVLCQHRLEAQQDLLHGLQKLVLVCIPAADLGQHTLWQQQKCNSSTGQRQPGRTGSLAMHVVSSQSKRECHKIP